MIISWFSDSFRKDGENLHCFWEKLVVIYILICFSFYAKHWMLFYVTATHKASFLYVQACIIVLVTVSLGGMEIAKSFDNTRASFKQGRQTFLFR